MNPKFFSLIKQGDVHFAPPKKIIPAEEFSLLLDGRELLDRVQEDAQNYRKEVLAECEKIKEQARKEGFEEGYQNWIEKLVELENEIKVVRQDVEKAAVPVAIKAAKKIVAKELEQSPATIVNIVSQALKAVAQHKKITIHVNPEEWKFIEEKREEVKGLFENLDALSIRPNIDVSKGGCIIETEGGIINAQLENQWIILENAFQKMLKKTPVLNGE